MTLDLTLLYFLNSLTGAYDNFDAIIVFLASYSQYVLIAAFLLFLYLVVCPKREKLYIFFTVAISVIASRLIITEIIRFFYNRPRPFITHQLHQLIQETGWSFPSGHSAFFFALAVAVYLYNKKWGVGFFIAALLMNISRIMAGVHYPSDILGGMAVGMVAAYIVFYFSKSFIHRV